MLGASLALLALSQILVPGFTMLLVLLACHYSSLEASDRMPDDDNAEDRSAASSDSSHSLSDQPAATTNPPCSHRTDHREGTGSGTIILTLEMPEGHVYTVRPVTNFSAGDTNTIPNTQLLGYDPAVGAEFLAGERGVIYWCEEGFWLYLGDLDVTQAMDSFRRPTSKVDQRYYNEDGTPQQTRQVDLPFRVTGVVIRQ